MASPTFNQPAVNNLLEKANSKHIRFLRLLNSCEKCIIQNENNLHPRRLQQLWKVLSDSLHELETNFTAASISSNNRNIIYKSIVPLSADSIQIYKTRIEELKSHLRLFLTNAGTHSPAKANQAQNEAACLNQMEVSSSSLQAEKSVSIEEPVWPQQRKPQGFQFSTTSSGSRGPSRLTQEEKRGVQREREVHQFLAQEMVKMTAELKDGALAINQTLRSQNQILSETENAAVENAELVSTEGRRLEKYLKSQGLGICEVLFLVSLVVASFMFTYLFIKVFPKRSMRKSPIPLQNKVPVQEIQTQRSSKDATTIHKTATLILEQCSSSESQGQSTLNIDCALEPTPVDEPQIEPQRGSSSCVDPSQAQPGSIQSEKVFPNHSMHKSSIPPQNMVPVSEQITQCSSKEAATIHETASLILKQCSSSESQGQSTHNIGCPLEPTPLDESQIGPVSVCSSCVEPSQAQSGSIQSEKVFENTETPFHKKWSEEVSEIKMHNTLDSAFGSYNYTDPNTQTNLEALE